MTAAAKIAAMILALATLFWGVAATAALLLWYGARAVMR